jgi:N-acetylmuramic acid 6-phosphate etherase
VRETERRHAGTLGLDGLPTPDLVDVLLRAHADVPMVVAEAAASTALVIDAAVSRLRAGGRLVYAGSGTPGWLVDADAAEIPPTFGFPREQLAVVRARSAAASSGAPDEDAVERGQDAIRSLALSRDDVVVAVASSGNTRFTLGAATQAADDGAYVISVTNVPGSALAAIATVGVELRTGPEPLMGSTRMRAGLAQRLWLTVFSTAVMVGLGRTFDNLMVNVAPVLDKLRERRLTILAEATGLDRDAATVALIAGGDDLRVAMVMVLGGADEPAARAALARCDGRVREALGLVAR